MYGLNWDVPLLAPRSISDARSENMKDMFLAGATMQDIGIKYGLTRERVRQILRRKYQITGIDGGESEIARRRLAAVDAKKDVYSQKRWGCSYAEYVAILHHPDKPTYFYTSDKRNWNRLYGHCDITLWQWWGLWQNSGHWSDRVAYPRRYRVSLVDPSGRCAINNVEIVRHDRFAWRYARD